MQGGGGREDVLEVLGAGFLEAVQGRVGEVLGEPLVVQSLPRQLDRLVLGRGDPHDLVVHLLTVQVAHGCMEMKPHDYFDSFLTSSNNSIKTQEAYNTVLEP